MPLLLFMALVALCVAGALFSAWQAKQRREAFRALAARLGLQFSAEKDYGLATRLRFLDRLARGDNRYAHNVLAGIFRGHGVMAFDFHYETHSTDSKGNRQTHHHTFSFFTLELPRGFPELTIAREGFLSKIAQAVGYDDIDFESAEFSRAFCVRSGDKRFAYDFCNARMIEYLLRNRDLGLEVEQNALAFGFDARLSPEDVERNLVRLIEVRQLIPDYLFDAA